MSEQIDTIDYADTSLILLKVASSLLQVSLDYLGEESAEEQSDNEQTSVIAKIIADSFTQIDTIFSDPERPNDTFIKLKALQKIFADESFEEIPLPQRIKMIRESLQIVPRTEILEEAQETSLEAQGNSPEAQETTGLEMEDCPTTPWCPPKRR